MTEVNKDKQTMNIEDISIKDLIPMMWSLKGKYLTTSGMRYRKAKPSEMANVVNWCDRDTFKMDAERFAMSKHATKRDKGRFITDDSGA